MQLTNSLVWGALSNGAPNSPLRRQFLVKASSFAIAPLLFSTNARASGEIKVISHWSTKNTTLYPFSLSADHLIINGNKSVEAFDIKSGKKNWINKLNNHAVFRPRLTVNGVISSGRSQINAFDKSTGVLQWTYNGSKELGVPLVHHGRVFFGDGHRLMALDAHSGKTIWSYETDKRARIGYAPTAFQDTVYLGPGDGVLYAFSETNGKLLWKIDREVDWQYLRQLSVNKHMLIAGGYHDEVFGINAENGAIRWRFNAGNFINSQLVTETSVYFWSPTGWVYSLDITSGKINWRHRTMDYNNPSKSSNWAPIMAELVSDQNKLYCLSMDHVLHVIDIESGKQISQYKMPVPMRPFISLETGTNRIFTGSVRGDVYQLELG